MNKKTRKIRVYFEVAEKAYAARLHEALCKAIYERNYRLLERYAPKVFNVEVIDQIATEVPK